MRTRAIDPEMQRRFNAAEKVRVADTDLRRPALRPDRDTLREHFMSSTGRAAVELSNPHVEPKITEADRADAVPASILIGIVLRETEPTVLVTQRHHAISHPGHWVFPGGRADVEDATPIDTALREAEEEIGLDPARVELLGRLGDYYSHSGFRIAPTIALVHPPFELTPHPAEVEAIAEIELSRLLDSSSYFLYRFEGRSDRAHFAIDTEREEIMLTGVTASICIGLYSELLKTHTKSG
jgi:8-oxo-dGTP pyrophosphatase MutT (NUDIX family)